MTHVQDAYYDLRTMKLSTKLNLLKENGLEGDELREIVENLCTLVDEYKLIACESDQSSDSGDDCEDDDY